MIWLTWRQHRMEALVVGCALAATLGLLATYALVSSSAFVHLGLDRCSDIDTRPCALAEGQFIRILGGVPTVGALALALVPVLLGMFVGAPLVAREVDRGTHRLAWSQSVSRGGWLLVAGAGALLLAGLAVAVLAVGLNWSLSTYLGVAQWGGTSRFDYWMFDALGFVPVAYTVFAVALGMAVGSILPRTLPAMLIVLVLFTAVRISVDAVARPRYMPATTITESLTGGKPAPRGAFTVTSELVGAPSGPCTQITPCLPGSIRITYQPADRFWPFQAIESAIYIAISILLLALTAHWVRRRVT